MYSWACKYEMVHCESMTTFLPMVLMATGWSQIFDAVNRAEITPSRKKTTTKIKVRQPRFEMDRTTAPQEKVTISPDDKKYTTGPQCITVYRLWSFSSEHSDWWSSGLPYEHY